MRPINARAFGESDNFVLGGPPLAPAIWRYASGLEPIALDATPQGDASWRMRATNSRAEPFPLALAGLAAVGWLAAGFLWWQGAQTQSHLTGQLTAAERARESLASDLQNPRKDGGRRRRPEKAGGRRREGAVGRLGCKGVGAKRTRRPDQADQRRQTRHFRRPGRGERQDARFASRRRAAQGRKRPRRGAAEPGPSPFGRADPPAGRRRRRAQGARAMLRHRRRPRRRNSRPCKARSTRRPPSSTPFKRKFARRSQQRVRPRSEPEPVTGQSQP